MLKSNSKERVLDNVNWQILQALQENARLSFVELGKRIGLTPPAVAERVRKLEEVGIITGYRAHVDLAQLGFSLLVFIRLVTSASQYEQVLDLARTLPEVLECHHITGGEAFIIKAVVTSVQHLEQLIGQFSPYGQTISSVVLSSPVVKETVDLPEEWV